MLWKISQHKEGVALAEVYYYQSNYNLAMTFDENSLLYNNTWYAGNILDEHFFAYTYAAIQSNQIERAIKFYNFFFEVKEQLNLPEHLINEYRYKVEQHILKLKGFNELKMYIAPLRMVEKGYDKKYFEELLKKYRPKLDFESVEGAECRILQN